MKRMLLLVPVVVAGCAAPRLESSCPIPDGVGCLSTSQVYDRLMKRQLPGLPDTPASAPTSSPIAPQAIDKTTYVQAAMRSEPEAAVTQPLYQAPKELRIWVNRWADEDGDLHDESFMYVVLGEGRWTLPEIAPSSAVASK